MLTLQAINGVIEIDTYIILDKKMNIFIKTAGEAVSLKLNKAQVQVLTTELQSQLLKWDLTGASNEQKNT